MSLCTEYYKMPNSLLGILPQQNDCIKQNSSLKEPAIVLKVTFIIFFVLVSTKNMNLFFNNMFYVKCNKKFLLKANKYSLDYTTYNKDIALSYDYTVYACDYFASSMAKPAR